MSKQYCAACRAAPAAVFCSADAAFLCALCDVAVHEANKLSRRHTRLPLHMVDQSTIHLSNPVTAFALDKNSSSETGVEDSDTSSGFLVVPDLDDASTQPVSPYAINHPILTPEPLRSELLVKDQLSWTPTASTSEQARLASIAGAFVKKEAQILLESTRGKIVEDGLVSDLDMSWVGGATPAVDANIHSTPGERVEDARGAGFFAKHERLSVTDLDFSFGDDFPQTSVAQVVPNSTATNQEKGRAVVEVSNAFRVGDVTCLQAMERSDEQKKQDRQAALKRFRNKRANRSFRKKVRYECRKQLADSRPRVKGRFVGGAKTTTTSRIQKSGKIGSTI